MPFMSTTTLLCNMHSLSSANERSYVQWDLAFRECLTLGYYLIQFGIIADINHHMFIISISKLRCKRISRHNNNCYLKLRSTTMKCLETRNLQYKKEETWTTWMRNSVVAVERTLNWNIHRYLLSSAFNSFVKDRRGLKNRMDLVN